MSFDIKKVNTVQQAEQGYEFELKMPDGPDGSKGTPTGAYLTVRGDYSPVVRNHLKRKISEYQMKLKVAERKKQEVPDQNIDEIEDEVREKAVIRVISWRGFVETVGEGKDEKKVEVAFSREAVENLLIANPWIQEQIMEESSNLSNFL